MLSDTCNKFVCILCNDDSECLHRSGRTDQMDKGADRFNAGPSGVSGAGEERAIVSEGLRSSQYPLTVDQFDALLLYLDEYRWSNGRLKTPNEYGVDREILRELLTGE